MTDNDPMILTPRGTKVLRHLIVYLLADILDDPVYHDETREAWADLKYLADETGVDLYEIARTCGNYGLTECTGDYELTRLGEIVGEKIR